MIKTRNNLSSSASSAGSASASSASLRREMLVRVLMAHLNSLRVDGVSNVLRAPHLCLRVMWSLVLAVSTCACAVLIVRSIQTYAAYQVTTTTRLIIEQRSLFPTITICSNNPLATDYAASLFVAANVTDDANNIFALETHALNTTGAYLSAAQIERMSNLDAMLVSCTFMNQPCYSANFTFIFDPINYNCYRFNANSNSLAYLSIPGETEKLKIELYAGLSNVQRNVSNPKVRSAFYTHI